MREEKTVKKHKSNEYDGPLCPFCNYQGTQKGNVLLFLACVGATTLLLLMVILSEL